VYQNFFYEFEYRAQTRVAGQSQTRKTYANVLIVHPYHNVYRFWHQTFTLFGEKVVVKGDDDQTKTNLNRVLENILREA
jgi:hypothetical protein